MKLTYYGHSCFGIRVNGKDLLFDPFITPNELAREIDVDQVPADYILLSHGHMDHVADAVGIAKRTGAQVISSFEIHEWLQAQGVTNTHPMNTGGRRSFDFGTVKCVVAQHSSTLPGGAPGGNPLGFLICSPEGDFYYSGDTALTLDMQLIPTWGKPAFAVMPVGDNFTMGYEDAAMAAQWVGCKKVIGVHFDTFGYIRIDHEAATRHFHSLGLELVLPGIGSVTGL